MTSREIPPEDTIEHFDYLLEALIEEALFQGYFGDNEEAVNFHAGMLRAAYQGALERKEQHENER